MEMSKTINIRDCIIHYSVFGVNKNYSAVSKVIIYSNRQELIKLVKLNNCYVTAVSAEEKIIEKSIKRLKAIYERSYFFLIFLVNVIFLNDWHSVYLLFLSRLVQSAAYPLNVRYLIYSVILVYLGNLLLSFVNFSVEMDGAIT